LNDRNREQVIDKTRNEVFELLKRTIKPEFLNRIDEIIMFKPLTKEEIHDIVGLQFNNIREMLAVNGIQITATEKAIDALTEMGFDPLFGARPLKRVIQKQVMNELSKMILAGKVSKDSNIMLDYKNDAFLFHNK
jgi:ATP-dependent Clp protease ATP-binding subunit ClpB